MCAAEENNGPRHCYVDAIFQPLNGILDVGFSSSTRRRKRMHHQRRGASKYYYPKLALSLVILCLFQGTWAFPHETTGWTAREAYYHHPQITTMTPQQTCLSKLHSLPLSNKDSWSRLEMSRSRGNHNGPPPSEENKGSDAGGNQNNNDKNNENNNNNKHEKRRLGKKEARKYRTAAAGGGAARGFGGRNATNTALLDAAASPETVIKSDREEEMLKRLTQLEHLMAKQTVEIRRLQEECRDLKDVSVAFAHVMKMLREAGLETPETLPKAGKSLAEEAAQRQKQAQADANDSSDSEKKKDQENDIGEDGVYEYFDEEIFGVAPASVIDAADAAGAAILAGLLGGKQRMLVDVRDSELSRDPETLVQFIELAILPVAAGLEGLKSNRNRVKIVFPTVSQLLEYRRTMALAAPEVVALSTLGFDPVEARDNIVVIVAPPPDNEEGLQAMNELLEPPEWQKDSQISQPVVVLNHHMVPLSGPAADYEVMYHLRLLSVQYMSGDRADAILQQFEGKSDKNVDTPDAEMKGNATADDLEKTREAELDAAMKHAQEGAVNHGLTRAMVIRAYPKPWHVFVDTSPDTDADFVVAATFDEEPGPEEVNDAIVECLEGSEREDEIVAQQMQEALEMKTGKLDIMNLNATKDDNESDENDDDIDDLYDLWNEDSI